MKKIQLSIIIPVLNESKLATALIECLSSQTGISFEAVFVDGGSTDDTVRIITGHSRSSSFPIRLLSCSKGRGKQLNFGAKIAKGQFFLFLHADSIFYDAYALERAVEDFNRHLKDAGNDRLAGRFMLKFKREKGCALNSRTLGYFFYEAKARLNKVECINGDQGILISRGFFKEAGPFDESFPFLEDKAFAVMAALKGRWVLLNTEIFTSSRRFEEEGMLQRQVLNAIIMNFYSISFKPFFYTASNIYKNQNNTERLNLFPFFMEIKRLFSGESFSDRASIWYKTGSYVNSNIWHIPFFFDVVVSFLKKEDRVKRMRFLTFFDTCIYPITGCRIVKYTTTLAVWLWFHSVIIYYKISNRQR